LTRFFLVLAGQRRQFQRQRRFAGRKTVLMQVLLFLGDTQIIQDVRIQGDGLLFKEGEAFPTGGGHGGFLSDRYSSATVRY